jgi:hypothetical protein
LQKVEEAKEHQTPSKTLFVVNFDVMRTTSEWPSVADGEGRGL